MDWYVPMTILPGLGLLILSTSNFLIALNSELTELCKDDERNHEAIDSKVLQIRRLSIAVSFQYGGVLTFLIAGLSGVTNLVGPNLFRYLMIAGVGFVTLAIIILLIYSIKAISIRQKLLKRN